MRNSSEQVIKSPHIKDQQAQRMGSPPNGETGSNQKTASESDFTAPALPSPLVATGALPPSLASPADFGTSEQRDQAAELVRRYSQNRSNTPRESKDLPTKLRRSWESPNVGRAHGFLPFANNLLGSMPSEPTRAASSPNRGTLPGISSVLGKRNREEKEDAIIKGTDPQSPVAPSNVGAQGDSKNTLDSSLKILRGDMLGATSMDAAMGNVNANTTEQGQANDISVLEDRRWTQALLNSSLLGSFGGPIQAEARLASILLGQHQLRSDLAFPGRASSLLGGGAQSVGGADPMLTNILNSFNPAVIAAARNRELAVLALYGFPGHNAGTFGRSFDPMSSLFPGLGLDARRQLAAGQQNPPYDSAMLTWHLSSSAAASRPGDPFQAAPQPATSTVQISSRIERPSVPSPGAQPRLLDPTHIMSISSMVPDDLPVVLAHSDDESRLSPYQILLRGQVEAFKAQADDVMSHARGRNRPISLFQVGIRCRHCISVPNADRKRGAVYYPFSLLGLYQAAQNMGTSHFSNGKCEQMPEDIRQQFVDVLACKSTIGAGKQYWAKAAFKIGLVDTDQGIRFIRDLQGGEGR